MIKQKDTMSERTFHQISQQYEAKHQEPTMLIRRSSGEIQTAHLTSHKDKNDRRFVEFTDADTGEAMYKPIAAEGLTDDAQEQLAQELSETANRSPEELERVRKTQEDLGSTAVDHVVTLVEDPQRPEVISSKKTEVKLKTENIERSIIKLDTSFGGELARVLKGVADDATGRRETIDPNTGDAGVRNDVEAVIRKVLDDLGSKQLLPERVQDNSPGNLKNIPSSRFGYENDKYMSRDYAAKLALAMLDGSFDGDPNKRDYNDLPADDPRNGQHRQAARMALEEFAKQKEEQDDSQERATDDDESFGDARRAIQQLAEDDMFQRANFSVHEFSDKYYQGLPHVFNPNEVMDEFQQHVRQLRSMSDDMESVIRRIHTLTDEVNPKNQAELEQIKMEMANAHSQIENTINIENMLVHKLDELSYDSNAEMEVRALFAQQFPLALNGLSQAFARIQSLTNR